ncbi:MAG: polyribonucleotide nucleotidyltransferase, partial [Clostridia bacterium]|nr:polyribonucleotide nucleotidyltransferase [Clostridia bacterium]
MIERKIFTTTIGGREVSIETGAYCGLSNGSCIVRCGDTAVMVNVTMAKTPRDGIDFFPLGVDYEEKMYAVGKIPGGFKKREGRASDKAILTSRLIDRPLRPLFPKGFFNDVAVVATALSVDPNIPPEVYAMIGSSVALSISDIPFAGPTGSVVVGYVDGKYIINPDTDEREKSKLHLSLSGTKEAILMVEAGANELTEDEMIGAILFGHEEIKKIVAFIDGIQAQIGKEKVVPELYHPAPEIEEAVKAYADKMMDDVLDNFNRQDRDKAEEALDKDVFAHFAEQFPDGKKDIADT